MQRDALGDREMMSVIEGHLRAKRFRHVCITSVKSTKGNYRSPRTIIFLDFIFAISGHRED